MNLLDLEKDAMAALHAAEQFFESDPAAKALADNAKASFAAAKTEALTATSDGIAKGVALALTPVLGETLAQVAGADAAQYIIANAAKYAAPVEAAIEHDLDIPEGGAA